jgi:uncharacterized protein YndB with AHSA1/START domain
MAKPFQQMRLGTLTDDTVQAKTGKTWEEWFKTLDKAGARMMDHREIVLTLQKQTGLSRWWSQMVAAGYANDRGIRQDQRAEPRDQRCEVTLTKVVAVPRAAAWAAWQDPGALAHWLPDARFELLKTVPQKILHLEWPGETRVSVRFYEQRGKTRVIVSHRGLTQSEAQRLRVYWGAALDRLRVMLAR